MNVKIGKLIGTVMGKALFANSAYYLITGLALISTSLLVPNPDLMASMCGAGAGILVFMWYPALMVESDARKDYQNDSDR